MDWGAWWATVHRVTKVLDTTEWLNHTVMTISQVVERAWNTHHAFPSRHHTE